MLSPSSRAGGRVGGTRYPGRHETWLSLRVGRLYCVYGSVSQVCVVSSLSLSLSLAVSLNQTGGKKMDNSVMILPQVHLRKPCYDFYFL